MDHTNSLLHIVSQGRHITFPTTPTQAFQHLSKEVHTRHLQIRLVSQGVVRVRYNLVSFHVPIICLSDTWQVSDLTFTDLTSHHRFIVTFSSPGPHLFYSDTNKMITSKLPHSIFDTDRPRLLVTRLQAQFSFTKVSRSKVQLFTEFTLWCWENQVMCACVFKEVDGLLRKRRVLFPRGEGFLENSLENCWVIFPRRPKSPSNFIQGPVLIG